MEDDYLTKCVVDPLRKKFYMYSNGGDQKEVECDTVDQFMNVLSVVLQLLKDKPDGILVYTNPL